MKTYFDHRKNIYASINGSIGGLTKLSKSKLLKRDEIEILQKAIVGMKELSASIKKNGI